MNEFLNEELEKLWDRIERIESDIEFLWKEIKELKKERLK
jgi:uncharacterized protein YdcH (DUF465 family)